MSNLSFFLLISFANLIVNPNPMKNHENTPSIHQYSIKTIDGDQIKLEKYKGKKILFVNVASKCGFTSQYSELQELHEKYKDNLVIIGLPCNQFGKQEPGTLTEIKSFCSLNYGVDFLMTEKVDVKGENQHPVYQWLTKKEMNGVKSTTVKWNFQKYLIDENGSYIDYYYSITKPMSKRITKHLK